MVTAFTHSTRIISSSRRSCSSKRLFLYSQNSNNLNSFLTSVAVFDGSDLTDTVVRSNTFWSTLSSKLPYFIAAELLATVTFVVIASVVASQGKFLIDKVTSETQKSKQFKRLDDASPRVQLDFTKLLLCIVIDILGSANEAVPLVGEVIDFAYAPIAALLLRQLFNGSNVVFLLEFAEEILPFTDILPLATICWVIEAFFSSGSLAKALRIGAYAPAVESDIDNKYIDVKTEFKSPALLRSNKQDRDS